MDLGSSAHRFAMWLKATPKPVLVAFAIVVAVKLGVLLVFGPASQQDTFGYSTCVSVGIWCFYLVVGGLTAVHAILLPWSTDRLWSAW